MKTVLHSSLLERAIPLNEQVYSLIREAIASGRVKAGERITERELAAKLDVSPTPVREALFCLAQEGLIERRGPRGVYVKELPVAMLPEMVYMAAALRGVAVRFAAQKMTEEELEELYDVLEQAREVYTTRPKDAAETLQALSEKFHLLINKGCRNEVLTNFLATLQVFGRSLRVRVIQTRLDLDLDYLIRGYHEHLAIAKALSARDGDLAEKLMREHTLRTGTAFTEALKNEMGF